MPETDWIDTLQESTDNVLVISPGDGANPGDLQTTDNPNPTYATTQDWYGAVIDGISAPGRDGNYLIQGTLGGTDPISGDDCAWTHAVNGDRGNQLWNGSTTDPDDTSSPVCRDLGTPGTPATSALNEDLFYKLQYSASAPFITASIEAAARLAVEGVWCLPVRDNLGPTGTIDGPSDPTADGAPVGATLEYESGLALTSVEITGDILDRATGTEEVTYFTNDPILPAYASGVWADHWSLGPPAQSSDLVFTYSTGSPVWQTLPFTSWDDCADYTAGEAPDVAVGICMSTLLGSTPTPSVSGNSSARFALRFTLLAPRYRWVWGDLTLPPQRIFQRSDGLTHSGARIFGGGNTRQSGPRTFGSIL